MEEKINAILISAADDVATAIVELNTGDIGKFLKNDEKVRVDITEAIPKFHKFAVRDIAKNEFVHKYGEVIGVATQGIGKGSYVHEHNIASPISSN